MTILVSKLDYISKINNVYANLNEFIDSFADEAMIINHVKCILLQNEELDSFNVNGLDVEVYKQNDGYTLFFADKQMNIDVYDNMVIDYCIE